MVEFQDGHPTTASDGDIPDGKYYTQKEFAELYDVPESTVRIWVFRGQIPVVSYYGRIYIPDWAVVAYKWPWMKRRAALKRNVSQT